MAAKIHNHTREQDCTDKCPVHPGYRTPIRLSDVVVPCVRPMKPGHWDY